MDYKQVLAALRGLSPKKQALIRALIVEDGPGLSGETPEGLRVTARSRKELRRFTNPKDPFVLEWIHSFEPGEVFYDIGANVGGVSLAVAGIHGKNVQIVAIEPSFSSFESLARNVSLNGLLGFTIPLQIALLDRTGLEPMHYRSLDAGTSLHAVGKAVDHEGNAFEPVEIQLVPTYRLDDLIEVLKLPAPTRIKIDVDGYEGPVLEGAPNTMTSGTVRDLSVEIVDHDRAGTRPAAIAELLRSWGYDSAGTYRHGADDGYVADYLFRRRDAAGEAVRHLHESPSLAPHP